jgi:hypothetical protein
VVKALSAMLRRAPGLPRKPDTLPTMARHGIVTAEPDAALAARRARRVVLIVLRSTAATRRDAEAA